MIKSDSMMCCQCMCCTVMYRALFGMPSLNQSGLRQSGVDPQQKCLPYPGRRLGRDSFDGVTAFFVGFAAIIQF